MVWGEQQLWSHSSLQEASSDAESSFESALKLVHSREIKGYPKNLILLMQPTWCFIDGSADWIRWIKLIQKKFFLQRSRWCTFTSPQESWILWFGERGQCSCCARRNVWGLRCRKPFSHTARAGPQRGPSLRRCYSRPITSRKRRKIMQGDPQYLRVWVLQKDTRTLFTKLCLWPHTSSNVW